MKLVWFCCYALLTSNAHGAVYKRIEADGSVVYTDIPGHNTQSVDLNSLSNNVIPSQKSPKQHQFANKLSSPKTDYQLSVTSPVNNATIRDNTGRLQVTGKIAPQHSGHFELLLNDKVVASQPTPYFVLENVPRGEYSIQLHLKNNKGKQIASSEIIKVYLHRASVLNRAN